MKLSLVLLAAALGLGVAGLSGCAGGKKDRPLPAPITVSTDNVVRLSVTDKGFEPTPVKVKGGQAVRLVITRVTDQTCATDIVVKDYDIKEKLPLNTEVTISFIPKKSGELKYGCAMDQMVNGVLIVE